MLQVLTCARSSDVAYSGPHTQLQGLQNSGNLIFILLHHCRITTSMPSRGKQSAVLEISGQGGWWLLFVVCCGPLAKAETDLFSTMIWNFCCAWILGSWSAEISQMQKNWNDRFWKSCKLNPCTSEIFYSQDQLYPGVTEYSSWGVSCCWTS